MSDSDTKAATPSAAGEIEHRYTQDIVCPHCGFEEGDSWERRRDYGDETCQECGQVFRWERAEAAEARVRELEKGGEQ